MSVLDFVPCNRKMFSEIANLWNAIEKYDNLTHLDFSQKYIDEFFSNRGVNLAEDIILIRRNRRLSAMGVLLFDYNVSELKAKLILMVHPFHRGYGIGKKLLEILLDRARKKGCREIICTIPNFRLYTLKFVEKFGFKKYHTKVKMRHDNILKITYKKKPDELLFKAINIQKDIDLWTSLQNEIFLTDSLHTEVTNNSIRRIAHNQNFIPNLAILGEVDNVHIGYCIGWLYNPTTSSSNTILRIIALGILQEFRRKGYGRALLNEVLWRGVNMGYCISELLVIDNNLAAQQLYQEIGFREKYRLLKYKYEF